MRGNHSLWISFFSQHGLIFPFHLIFCYSLPCSTCLMAFLSSFKIDMETSLTVQWLRLWASTAGVTGSIPGQETKISTCRMVWPKKKKKKKKSIHPPTPGPLREGCIYWEMFPLYCWLWRPQAPFTSSFVIFIEVPRLPKTWGNGTDSPSPQNSYSCWGWGGTQTKKKHNK